MVAIQPLHKGSKRLCRLISNWLALVVLLLLGVVWPPVFASGVTNMAPVGSGAMGDGGVLFALTDTQSTLCVLR